MDREQQQDTIIDLDERDSPRIRVGTAIVAMLFAVLAATPFVIDDVTSRTDPRVVTLHAGRSAPPAHCIPAFDVPRVLDPVARIILPGWTRLCGWLDQVDGIEPLDPSS